ncbi:MAG: hypothetical protein MJ233_04300 [Mycoplasmoidaceae bacterium]|nr:hypothetical protein [Mycoplasmoidaceae bacterium]
MNDPDWFVEGTFDFTNLSDDAYFKNMRFDSKNISDNWNEYGRSIMRCITAVGADISPYFYDVEHPEDPEEI